MHKGKVITFKMYNQLYFVTFEAIKSILIKYILVVRDCVQVLKDLVDTLGINVQKTFIFVYFYNKKYD